MPLTTAFKILNKPLYFSEIINWLFNRKVGFREDGTIRSCGYECYINGEWTKICTKYLTGVTGATATTLIPHGLSMDNILSVECAINNGTKFCKAEYNLTPTVSDGFNYSWDNTHVIIDKIGVSFRGNEYRIKVEYKNGS